MMYKRPHVLTNVTCYTFFAVHILLCIAKSINSLTAAVSPVVELARAVRVVVFSWINTIRNMPDPVVIEHRDKIVIQGDSLPPQINPLPGLIITWQSSWAQACRNTV